MQSRWWEFGGDTIIRADSYGHARIAGNTYLREHSYVRLASDRPSQAGWIFSRLPLTATNWQVLFSQPPGLGPY